MVHRVEHTANIEVLFHTETREIIGNGQTVEGVRVVNNQSREEKVLDVTGFFVAIGHKPNTDVFKGWLDMDETGYRSEEHTSELQSLMRISYAVFCLKKKKNTQHNTR